MTQRLVAGAAGTQTARARHEEAVRQQTEGCAAARSVARGPPGTHRRLLHPAVWEPWQLHPQGCISGLVLPRALHALLRLPRGMEWSEWAEVGYFRAFPAILGSGCEALWAGQGQGLGSAVAAGLDAGWGSRGPGFPSHRKPRKRWKACLEDFHSQGLHPSCFHPKPTNLSMPVAAKSPRWVTLPLAPRGTGMLFLLTVLAKKFPRNPDGMSSSRGRGCLQHDGDVALPRAQRRVRACIARALGKEAKLLGRSCGEGVKQSQMTHFGAVTGTSAGAGHNQPGWAWHGFQPCSRHGCVNTAQERLPESSSGSKNTQRW